MLVNPSSLWISNTVEYDLERMLSEYCRAISSVHSWLGLPLWDSQVYSVLWLHPEEAALKDFSIAVLFIYSVVSVSCVQQSDSVLYKKYIYCCSVTKSCLTLCDSMDCNTPGSLSFAISHSLLKFICLEPVPSNHLILCCLLLLLPLIFPSIRVFSNVSTLCIRWPKY